MYGFGDDSLGSSAYLWEAPIPHSRTLILVQPHLIMEISETNGSLLRNNDSVIISNPRFNNACHVIRSHFGSSFVNGSAGHN